MRSLILIIFLVFTVRAGAQESLNFRTVDSLTYHYYLSSSWDSLIGVGDKALEEGVDYYYLQMRLAYAYFMKGRYRKAIPYYKNALEFNYKDPVAHEYLYYSYKYAGRTNDAIAQRANLTLEQKNKIGIPDTSNLVSFGVNHSYAFSNASDMQESLLEGVTLQQADGIQKANHAYHLPAMQLSHRMGSRVMVHHRLHYLRKNELSYAVVNGTPYYSPEQVMHQLGYGLILDFRLFDGIILSVGGKYRGLRIPVYASSDYGMNAGRERDLLYYLKEKGYNAHLKVKQNFTYATLGISYAINMLNGISSQQAGIHSVIYPFSNLNLYYNLDLYFQQLNDSYTSENHILSHHLIGFKILKNLWVEASTTLPSYMHFFDVTNNLLYNNLEKTRQHAGLSFILPVYGKNFSFISSFGYSWNQSYFYPEEQRLQLSNKQPYEQITITGGILWKR